QSHRDAIAKQGDKTVVSETVGDRCGRHHPVMFEVGGIDPIAEQKGANSSALGNLSFVGHWQAPRNPLFKMAYRGAFGQMGAISAARPVRPRQLMQKEMRRRHRRRIALKSRRQSAYWPNL